MDRRELLTLAAVALPTAGLALWPNPVRAQGKGLDGVVDEIVRTREWVGNAEVYLRFRWGAFSYASLVRHFGPPNGNVPNDLPFDLLEDLLPGSMEQWVGEMVSPVRTFAAAQEGELVKALAEVQAANSRIHEAWLERVGIVPSGQVSIAILSGQALATLVSLAREGGDGRNIRDRIRNLDRWFYPFCV